MIPLYFYLVASIGLMGIGACYMVLVQILVALKDIKGKLK